MSSTKSEEETAWGPSVGGESPITVHHRCALCNSQFRDPKVLACLHSYCRECVEGLVDGSAAPKVICPQCHIQTQLSPHLGVDCLLSDYGVMGAMQLAAGDSLLSNPGDTSCDLNSNLHGVCGGCKSGLPPTSFCEDCAQSLCTGCTNAHGGMLCFEEHRLSPLVTTNIPLPNCILHSSEPIGFFCSTCNAAVCGECVQGEHRSPLHRVDPLEEVIDDQMRDIHNSLHNARSALQMFAHLSKMSETAQMRLNDSMSRAQQSIVNSSGALIRFVEEGRAEAEANIQKEKEFKSLQLAIPSKKMENVSRKLAQTVQFTEHLLKNAPPAGVLVFKQLLQRRFEVLLSTEMPDPQYLSRSSSITSLPPLNLQLAKEQINAFMETGGSRKRVERSSSTPLLRSAQRPDWEALTMQLMQQNIDGSLFPTPSIDSSFGGIAFGERSNASGSSTVTLTPQSQLKRHKMIYYCKFGEFGVMEGQFTEPSGVAVTARNEIVVADTNNHRIQVFDHEGRFKFHFGEFGKRQGQLLYPNRVAVNKLTGEFIVTERSPTHQVQVFNQFGQFVRKFGADVLQHPRGVCVDNKGRIVTVECKVMRVFVFDMRGNVLYKFSCVPHLEFPNGVCTNDRQQIFISDNRAHCVKVFSYQGDFLGDIGGEGVTNFPIGVGINSVGQVIVADNHNNFNITVFNQDGSIVSALESKVKHAQCFDVALLGEGSVVLASKDYRLYMYKYRAGVIN